MLQRHPLLSKPKRVPKPIGIPVLFAEPKDLLLISEKPIVLENKVFEIEYSKESDLWGPGDNHFKKGASHRIILIEPGRKDRYLNSPYISGRVMTNGVMGERPIDDNYYLSVYERFIKEEICFDPSCEFPKLVNTISEQCSFDSGKYSESNYEPRKALYGKIVFENHPENLELADFLLTFKKTSYFQPVSGAYSTKAKLCSIKNLPDCIKNHFYLELLESAIAQVIIVDERVGEWANNQAFHGVKIHDILLKMNVLVIDVDKKKVLPDVLKSKLLEAQKNDIKRFRVADDDVRRNAHFFVIHLGILNKLGSGAKEFMDWVKCRWKVVASGRGVHHSEIPLNAKLVEISALQSLLSNYDKHGLVNLFFTAQTTLNQPLRNYYGN